LRPFVALRVTPAVLSPAVLLQLACGSNTAVPIRLALLPERTEGADRGRGRGQRFHLFLFFRKPLFWLGLYWDWLRCLFRRRVADFVLTTHSRLPEGPQTVVAYTFFYEVKELLAIGDHISKAN
jgi:hypothetical protein